MPASNAQANRQGASPFGTTPDMSLDIVSYGRKGPGGVLRFSSDEIAQIRRTVDRAPEVMVKVTGGGRDASSVQVHLDYIGRHGKLPLEDDEGRTHQGRNAARELASDWQLELCKGQYKSKPRKGQTDSRPKVAHNIVLSMPQGTPSDKLLKTVRAFARTNFGQRHRYAMTLHVDQAHPHVHLVVKSEQEYEPTKRLCIYKATLRQWREQFAALLREEGVTANATARQVRGQMRTPYSTAVHHRLQALQAAARLPPGEKSQHQAPKTSTFMQGKIEKVLYLLGTQEHVIDHGLEAMQRTRQGVLHDWRATAQQLRRQGEAELAVQVDRFVASMPAVQTDARWLAERWKAQAERRPDPTALAPDKGPRTR